MGRDRGTLTLRREDGRVVCESVTVCDTTLRRLRGLLGRSGLRQDQGLLLRPAWSIHTAFMRFSIDVVFVDHDQTVVRIHPSLKPFHTASCRGAREVVELRAGECARRGLEVGDRIAWAPRGQFDEGPSRENHLADVESRGIVVVASSEPRFAKLAKFLLTGQSVTVAETVAADDAVSAVDESTDAVLLDIGDSLAEGLRTANAIRSLRPEVQVVLAGEAPEGTPFAGVRVYDRWNETEQMVEAVLRALDEKGNGGTQSVGLIA